MSITKEQQQALDDALVPREQRLRIGNCNYRLSTTFKPKEPTFQVALDVLSLTPFYQAFLISANVPAIYVHEFWATVSFHKHNIKFKLNKKSHSFDLETFRDMLQICPKLPGQKFEDPSFEEEILAFIRELSYSRNIKSLLDVKEKSEQAPKASPGKRLKATAKVAKSRKNKLPAKGLEVLSEMALSEAEQMKIAIERSKTQLHNSHASSSGAHEGTGVTPRVPDVPTYCSDDEQISWKSSDEDDDDEVSMSKDDDDNADDEDDDDQDDDNEQTESDNDGDDFVHPKFSTHDEEERQDEEDKDEEYSSQRVHTPSHTKSTDDEAYDEVTQGGNDEEEKLDEEEPNEEEEVDEMYRDVNINLERRDTEMTDAPQTNVQATQVIKDTHVIMTTVTLEVQHQSSSVSSGFISQMLNPNQDTGTNSILNQNTQLHTHVNVPVSAVEIPPSSATTLPRPPIPLIQHLQQTPVFTSTIVPSTSLQNLPTFASLFKFKDRVKSLEKYFSEFKQTSQFAEAVSSIPGIVDNYLASKLKDVVDVSVQLKLDRLREEAQAENQDFLNKIDENMKKVIKEQVKAQVKEQINKILPRIEKSVNEQLEAKVMIRSSNEAKTSHVVAANLSKLELKKILIDKMENNKSIDRSIQQKTLYKALVDAYETDKDILETYGDVVTFKRQPESTSASKDKTSKSIGSSKEGSKSSKFAQEQVHTDKDLEEPTHQEFETGFTEEQPVDETSQLPDWKFARDVYSRHRIIAITKLKIVEWQNYKHLDWITIRKLKNLTIEERQALGVKLRMFTRSIVIRRRVEDLQLGVESYQKKINLIKPDTYRSDLKRKTTYIAYSNPRSFIYQNKDKKNRLMRIDELPKFSDGTLNDGRTALDDIMKRIRMEYLPQTFWRNVDMERAGAMIQAIDQQLKNRRIMRSLEKFVGGRPSAAGKDHMIYHMITERFYRKISTRYCRVLRNDTKEKSEIGIKRPEIELTLDKTLRGVEE
ncbi:hypothetical protein Tco_0975226 [Tanacetum coccineum]|uniref:Uncharacterized protein n=1 Tax=Tanacetum coccineum TaxID=301880 RepID=A0ABQ5EDS6_9ASTR